MNQMLYCCKLGLKNKFSSVRRLGLLLLFIFITFGQQAQAAAPLVSAQWLQENLSQPNIRILDLQPTSGYERVHLPGAINSQYNIWRQNKPMQGQALPDIAYLEKLMGSLGISNNTHVILTPVGANPSEIAIATRIYWSMKVLGHKAVSILDGGLIAYSKLPKASFTQAKTPVRSVPYTAVPNLAMAPSAMDVLSEWKKGTPLVDYRSEAEYFGKVGGTRLGTITGAKNLPYDLLLEQGQGGRFLPVNKLKTLFQSRNINTSGPAIGFCNSGHRASLAWFVSHEILGNKEALLYDGSMAEWSKQPDYPISIPK
ncbi:sulfurtransferase [Cohaesibacter celericrescens]|uniref:Sulfurtransferase n=1 Tax=Cohaesibacter celericrescens TaxID=2067669 RepID=A0A2N5XVS7_9HYPH|nr:rhodanese-like domain-containing protein [Cohaesibacter celericrescens]PLW78611.1 sulfurtransferase [Cohaesibacter celericrescens]